MISEKKSRLEKAGFRAGSATEFLNLSTAEATLVAEARRRGAELVANPSAGLTDQQFRAAIPASRKG